MAAKPKTMVGVLPREIWSEILTRVSVKTILRCRSVCKYWYCLISSPNFVSYHSTKNLNKNGNRVLVRVCDRNYNVRSFSSHDKSFMESREHDDVPELFLRGNPQIVGSCNGLVCLSNACSSAISFLIWNPTIGKIVELPSRSFCSRTQRLSNVGFGFDSNANDYKVLCIVANKSAGDLSVANIYDLRKGVWRVISPLVGSSRCVGSPNQDYYLNGAVHWSAKRFDGVILSFNMSDEVFREIRMPNGQEFIDDGNNGAGRGRIKTQSVTFDGLIHVIVWKSDRNGYSSVPHNCSVFSVWAMKEYGVAESWTKVFNIDLRSAQVSPSTHLWPNYVRLWDNDEVLMACYLLLYDGITWQQYSALYSVGSRKIERLLPLTKWVSNLCLYEESLVLM